MSHDSDAATPAAALVVVLVAALGGGFWPGQRLVVGLALIVVWAIAAWRWSGGPDRVELGLGTLLVWGAVSACLVGAAPLASKEAVTTWLVAFALWATVRRGSGPSRRLAVGVMAAGAVVVAVAVLVAAAVAGSIRVGGLLENPNLAAALLLPTLPLGWAAIGPKWPRVRVVWAVVLVAGIVLTGSRAGLLALLVVVAVLLPRGRLRTVGTLAATILAVAALVWRFVSQPDLLAWHRLSIWRAVVSIWAAHPVTGVGPGSLVEAAGVERILHPDQIGRYQFVISVAESTPLAVLVQLGVVGLVIAVAVGLMVVASLRRSGALGVPAARASLAAAAVFALFHDLLTADPVLWWWAVLAGAFERPMEAARSDPDASLFPAAIRWLLGLGMAWLTAWGVLAPAQARILWQSSAPTADAVERALRVEPWFDDAPAGRVRALLAEPGTWRWRTAAEALHWAEVARCAHPGLARRWADLGRVRLRIVTDCGGTEHDVEPAERDLERACALDPHLPWTWLERARLARITGNQERAIALTRRALEEEPNTVRGWLMLARLEAEMGRAEAAREALAEAGTRAALISQRGLTDYERELLEISQSQYDAVARALGIDSGTRGGH